MDKVEQLTYQGIAPWMLWVAVLAGIAIYVAIAALWKVVEINRGEKKRKQDEIRSIAEDAVDDKVDSLADDISRKVMDAMKDKFEAIDRKLENDKLDIESAKKRSAEHDRALERIEQTLENVDKNITDMSEGFTYLARGTIATLNHQIHNGNKEELEEAAKELNRFLTHRPIVPTGTKKEG